MRADADLERLDLYELLGVAKSAKPQEIRAAYRRRARESHPDLNPLDPASGARMARLNRAARILLDPSRRAAYDQARRRSAPPRGASWYERAAAGSEWDVPVAAARPTSAAGRRFSRRVRGRGDVLALRAAEWLLTLGSGQQLLLAALCIAFGSGLVMWSHPVNAFWTSPPSVSEQASAPNP